MFTSKADRIYLDVAVRDFGHGPCLATVGGGATIVLSAYSKNRTAKARIVSCDDSCVLTEQVGLDVLNDIAALWNERAARLRAARSLAQTVPS